MTELSQHPEQGSGGNGSAEFYRHLADPDHGTQESGLSPEQPAPPRLIVEVGTGSMPRLGNVRHQSVAERRHLGSNERYLGFELGAQGGLEPPLPSVAAARDARMRREWGRIQAERRDEQIQFLQSDGATLPLRDNSAAEVLLVNVLGFGAPNPRHWPGLLSEANRVLDTHGTLVVQDVMTPEHYEVAKMEDLVNKSGLEPAPDRMRLIRKDESPDEYSGLVEKYGLDPGADDQHSFIYLISKLDLQPAAQPKQTRLRWRRRRARQRPASPEDDARPDS